MTRAGTALVDFDVAALQAAELTGVALRIAAEQSRLAGLQAQIAVRLTEASARSSASADEWLDATAAAAYLKLPKSWVRDKARRGLLRSHRRGRYVRFRRGELDEDAARLA